MKQSKIDLGKLLLRIGVGGLMLFHGFNKLSHGFDSIKKMLLDNGLPQWLWIGAFFGETIAPLCILFGVATRISASLVAVTILFSIYLAYGISGFKIGQYGAFVVELNLLYLFASLALVFLGGGKYGLYKKETGLLA